MHKQNIFQIFLPSHARKFVMSLLVIFITTTTQHSANAQNRNFTTYFLDVAPAKFVAAALTQPYGQAVVARFAAALSNSADPKCLKDKKITTEQLEGRARTLLLERGSLMLERLILMTDRKAFKSYLHARIGSEGMAELERLRSDPTVRTYLAADEPAEQVFMAQYIVDMIERYAKIQRINFAIPFNPISTDIPSLETTNPTDKIDVALKQMIADDKSGTLSRYLELVAIAQKPYRDAANMDLAKKFGPGELLARPGKANSDLYNELVALCVAQSATLPR